MPVQSLQKVIANFSGVTRNDTLQGKEYLVAPAIIIVEGVLNGSEGPLLYPAEELRKSVLLWNLKPAVLYHPKKNGAGVTACSPEVLDTRGLGMMMNTRIDEVVVDGKKLPALKTEVWLDMDQVKKVDERVLEAVENNEVMELSTGLLTDNEMIEGEFNGVHYDAIARNYRPDHLAILPDQKGACSIEDGAGFLRLNKAGDTLTFPIKIANDKTKEWIKNNQKRLLHLISDLLNDVLENEIIKNVKDKDMAKKKKEKIVDGLIENKSTQWTEDNREWLMTQEEDVLDNMNPIVDEEDAKVLTLAKEIVEKAEAEKKAIENKQKEDKNKNVQVNNAEPETVETFLKKAPPEIRSMLQNGLDSHKADKKRLVNVITANDRNTYTEDQLENKDLNELRQLAALATTTDKQKEELATVNYGGQGETVHNEVVEEPLPVPSTT